MADRIGAVAAKAASATGNVRPHEAGGGGVNAEPSPADVAATPTPAMRRALWRRQDDMVEPPRSTVTGHGMTMRALRARGVVVGAMPHALVTARGRAVIDAARLGPTDGDQPILSPTKE